jgi:hypothetical protein
LSLTIHDALRELKEELQCLKEAEAILEKLARLREPERKRPGRKRRAFEEPARSRSSRASWCGAGERG